MQVKEHEVKTANLKTKENLSVSHHPTKDQLQYLTSEQLIKMLLSPEMERSENAPLRQQIIKILQERKGNAFVQNLLVGKTSSGK
jgi:hypothetical protein